MIPFGFNPPQLCVPIGSKLRSFGTKAAFRPLPFVCPWLKFTRSYLACSCDQLVCGWRACSTNPGYTRGVLPFRNGHYFCCFYNNTLLGCIPGLAWTLSRRIQNTLQYLLKGKKLLESGRGTGSLLSHSLTIVTQQVFVGRPGWGEEGPFGSFNYYNLKFSQSAMF